MQKQLKSENKILEGFILVNKQPGCTSFDIVKKINRLTQSKAGHCGTLDPFAEGVLIIALGKATRYIEYVLNQNKEYIFDISWGKNTDSHDSTGNILQESKAIPTQKEIENKIKHFTGKIQQIPPIFSAIKINGRRAYNYARNKEEVTLNPREVNINNFELLTHSKENSRFRIKCSKGTYVRSIAIDLCTSLNCCGHVSYLQRTKIANFLIKNSFTIEEIEKKYNNNKLSESILTIDKVLHFMNSFHPNKELYTKLKHGSKVSINNLPFPKESIIKLKFNERFFGLALYDGNILRPKKIFIN